MTEYQWLLAAPAAILVGMSRTLHAGLSMIFIPLLAAAFGAKVSSGLIIPLLVAGDVMAISLFRRRADLKTIIGLAPWTALGMIAGLIFGGGLPERAFKLVVGFIVLGCTLLSLWQDQKGTAISISRNPVLAAATGMLAGFTTMIGNAAGPIVSIYLLASGLRRDAYIGTAAWFFFSVNIWKLPLQFFFWKNLGMESFLTDAMLLPFLGVGLIGGLWLARRLPEKGFRIFVYCISFLSSFWLILRR